MILTILNLFRGVLDTGAHIGASKNSSQVFDPPSYDPLVDKYRVDTFTSSRLQTNNRKDGIDSTRKPSWLLGLGSNSTSQNNSSNGYYNNNNNSSSNSSSGLSGYPLLEGGLRRYQVLIIILVLVVVMILLIFLS